MNVPVLQSSSLACGCTVALAGICLSLLPGQPAKPGLGHTEVPVALGSVPSLSLGRRGGRCAAGREVLRHKALLKNLNISDSGEELAFHSLWVGQITVTDQ